MRNGALAKDYVRRAGIRLTAIDALHRAESWADVVRECQEAVELALKGLLRACHVAPPRLHDVSDVLRRERERLPPSARRHVERMARISRELRRDRELAFYGMEDLVPSDFYKEEDARRALDGAEFVVATATAALADRGGGPAGEPAEGDAVDHAGGTTASS